MTTTLSKIGDGSTWHEFLFHALQITQTIPSDATFDIDTENYTVEIENVEGMVRKSILITGMLISENGNSATTKQFNLLNYLRVNTNTTLTVVLQLDGGDLVKTWRGKILDDVVTSIISTRPKDIMFTFKFVLTGASW